MGNFIFEFVAMWKFIKVSEKFIFQDEGALQYTRWL